VQYNCVVRRTGFHRRDIGRAFQCLAIGSPSNSLLVPTPMKGMLGCKRETITTRESLSRTPSFSCESDTGLNVHDDHWFCALVANPTHQDTRECHKRPPNSCWPPPSWGETTRTGGTKKQCDKEKLAHWKSKFFPSALFVQMIFFHCWLDFLSEHLRWLACLHLMVQTK